MMRLAAFSVAFGVVWTVARAQPAGTGPDFTTTVSGVPTLVLPATQDGRSAIFFQVQGGGAVACRPDGLPGFGGGSYELRGDDGTPPIGGSLLLSGPLADPRAWSCIAYPPGGAATIQLTVKAYR